MNIDNGGVSPFVLARPNSADDIIELRGFEFVLGAATNLAFWSGTGVKLASYDFLGAGDNGIVSVNSSGSQTSPGQNLIMTTTPPVQVNGRATIFNNGRGILS